MNKKSWYKAREVIMKKILSLLLCTVSIIFLSACSGLEGESSDTDSINLFETETSDSTIPEWLTLFYDGNYEYLKSTIVLEEQDEKVLSIIEGKKVASPYTEYQNIIQPTQSSWSEAYYYGEGDNVTALLNTANGYISQKIERSYPYGYGQKLEFVKDETIMYEETLCDVYTAEYMVNVAEELNQHSGKEQISDSLTAVISMVYYVDPKDNKLLCMITDISDLNKKTDIGMAMITNGLSLKEAQEESGTDVITKEKMEILSYDDNLSIDIPNS